jgi:formamidopyrimidine-DNA glycosylase
MPELPEVETIARGLAQRVTGEVIDSVWLGQKPEPLKSPAQEISHTLEHSRIVSVHRIGKHIVFDLELEQASVARTCPERESKGLLPAKPPNDSGMRSAAYPELAEGARAVGKKPKRSQLRSGERKGAAQSPNQNTSHFIVHLGMTGRLQVYDPSMEVPKHTHAILKLSSGRELRFIDPRRFGRLSVVRGFDATGVEPLEIDLDRFVPLFRGRKTPIKSALLNQKLLRGVGNIYADESLFRAGIRPRRRASTITRDEFARLLRAIKEVLNEAIAAGGSSISDYVDPDGEEGFFQSQHRVYGREGEPCLVCKTPLKRIVIAGRSSHYCPKCQR